MTDLDLDALEELAKATDDWRNCAETDFRREANPLTILSLIAEIRRLRTVDDAMVERSARAMVSTRICYAPSYADFRVIARAALTAALTGKDE